MIKNKKSFALEIMWLVLAIIGIGMGIFKSFTINFSSGFPFLIIAVISAIMFTVRWYARKFSK